jgi:hypothetical protein
MRNMACCAAQYRNMRCEKPVLLPAMLWLSL